jgi:hypothetical protein
MSQVNNIIEGQKERFEVQHKQEQKPFIKLEQQQQRKVIKM